MFGLNLHADDTVFRPLLKTLLQQYSGRRCYLKYEWLAPQITFHVFDFSQSSLWGANSVINQPLFLPFRVLIVALEVLCWSSLNNISFRSIYFSAYGWIISLTDLKLIRSKDFFTPDLVVLAFNRKCYSYRTLVSLTSRCRVFLSLDHLHCNRQRLLAFLSNPATSISSLSLLVPNKPFDFVFEGCSLSHPLSYRLLPYSIRAEFHPNSSNLIPTPDSFGLVVTGSFHPLDAIRNIDPLFSALSATSMHFLRRELYESSSQLAPLGIRVFCTNYFFRSGESGHISYLNQPNSIRYKSHCFAYCPSEFLGLLAQGTLEAMHCGCICFIEAEVLSTLPDYLQQALVPFEPSIPNLVEVYARYRLLPPSQIAELRQKSVEAAVKYTSSSLSILT